ATAFFGKPVPPGETPAVAALDHVLNWSFLGLLVHLWFLWFLLVLFAVMLPLARIGDWLHHRSIGHNWDTASRWLLQSRFRWPILALFTLPLLLPMTNPTGPDTSLDWTPPAYLLAYYFLFFVVGWTLYRHRDLLSRFAGDWKRSLAVGHLIVLPI